MDRRGFLRAGSAFVAAAAASGGAALLAPPAGARAAGPGATGATGDAPAGPPAPGPGGARIVSRSGSGPDPELTRSSTPRTLTLGAGVAALVTGGALALRRRTAR